MEKVIPESFQRLLRMLAAAEGTSKFVEAIRLRRRQETYNVPQSHSRRRCIDHDPQRLHWHACGSSRQQLGFGPDRVIKAQPNPAIRTTTMHSRVTASLAALIMFVMALCALLVTLGRFYLLESFLA